MIQVIQDKLDEIKLLCKNHRVKSFFLFGSGAKGNYNQHSDLDFLVQFAEDISLMDYADNYFSLLEGLELITGKRVDLVTEKSLKNPILIEEIHRTKEFLYAG
jgi:hypothetical protein